MYLVRRLFKVFQKPLNSYKCEGNFYKLIKRRKYNTYEEVRTYKFIILC